MPLITSRRGGTKQPQAAVEVDRRYGLRRAIVIGTARNVDLVENIVVTTSDGSSIAPAIATSSGLGYLGNGNLYNSLISVPAWTNTTNEASLCLVFEGRMETGWIAGSGSLTHFPFSNLLYCNTFWNGRWANGISLLSGDSWDGPHRIVITVKDGSQKIFHNGRLWSSATATGGFTLPSTISFFPRQTSTVVSPVAAFAWDSYLHSDLAISYSSNPWQVIKKQNKRIWIPSGGGVTIACTPGNATTAGISASVSAATIIACNVGGATTAGVACALPLNVACNVGNATPAGISCSIPVVVQCNVGTATTAGVSASISLDSSITISCNVGNATTSGVTAGIAGSTVISCNVGNASVAGISAGIAGAITISCNTGTATTSGIAATFPQSLSCNAGNATTAGITAQVDIAGQIVIGCNVGTATTSGVSANISSAFVLACNPGNATTIGATAYFPQSLQCTPGNAIALGINATFTVAGPTTIVCNAGNAYAAGVHCDFGSRFDTSPDAIVTVINKRNRVSVISRRS